MVYSRISSKMILLIARQKVRLKIAWKESVQGVSRIGTVSLQTKISRV